MTGLSGSGKTTLSYNVKRELAKLGHRVEVIDGDEYRATLSKGLGFSREDRSENIRRLGVVAGVLARNGVIVLLSVVNPYEDIRAEIRSGTAPVKTVWVKCDLETLVERDTKGLYRRAMLPDEHPDKLHNLTGVNDPFETPVDADLIIRTDTESVAESSSKLLDLIISNLEKTASKSPKALFIGRWQPFHNGHKWLIDQKLSQGVPVLIAVRDVAPDENNPLTTAQTIEILRAIYGTDDVEIIPISNIESVNFGRGVGYEINEFAPPPEIGSISATEIRVLLQEGSDEWKNFVDERIYQLVAKYLS